MSKFFLSLQELGLDMMILRTGVSEISEESSDLIQGFNEEVCNDLGYSLACHDPCNLFCFKFERVVCHRAL